MDEHEALIEYSEMTSFDFNSKEFQEVRKDYIECRDVISSLMQIIKNGILKTTKLPNLSPLATVARSRRTVDNGNLGVQSSQKGVIIELALSNLTK